jgi:hypothetical protein
MPAPSVALHPPRPPSPKHFGLPQDPGVAGGIPGAVPASGVGGAGESGGGVGVAGFGDAFDPPCEPSSGVAFDAGARAGDTP